MTTLFDVLADGSSRTYFDVLESQGVSTATAHARVSVSATTDGDRTLVWFPPAFASVVITAQGQQNQKIGSASATVSISARNGPLDTVVWIRPRPALIEIRGTAVQRKVATARATVSIGAQNNPSETLLWFPPAQASLSVHAQGQSIITATAASAVIITAEAAGDLDSDLKIARASARVVVGAAVSSRTIGTAAAYVAISGNASVRSAIVARASARVVISASAAEAQGFITFPRASATIRIGARAAARAIVTPAKDNVPQVAGKTIDWKTLCDAQGYPPPVAEYEFSSTAVRRVFKKAG